MPWLPPCQMLQRFIHPKAQTSLEAQREVNVKRNIFAIQERNDHLPEGGSCRGLACSFAGVRRQNSEPRMVCLSQGCTRGTVLFMVLSEALLGDTPHSCSESMATLAVLPAAAQQQVQLLQEQREEQQDAPKQHICQGRLQRHAGLIRPLLPSSCSSHTSAVCWMSVCAPGKLQQG